MKWIKRTGLIILVVLAGIQFIPISRNNSAEKPSTDFIQYYKPTEKISNILKVSCYNCHSNHTDYPWYSHIQPIGFYLENHIDEGKEHLNLSEYKNYSARQQRNKLTFMIGQIEENEMPLPAYTFIHRDAKLSDEDKKDLIAYLESLKEGI